MAPASGASTSTVSSRAEGKPRLRARSSRWLSDPSCRLQAWAQPHPGPRVPLPRRDPLGAGLHLHTGPLNTWLVAWGSDAYRQPPGSLAVSAPWAQCLMGQSPSPACEACQRPRGTTADCSGADMTLRPRARCRLTRKAQPLPRDHEDRAAP